MTEGAITHIQVENHLAARVADPAIALDPTLESAVKLGLLIDLVTGALNSDDALRKLRDDVLRNKENLTPE